MRETTSSSGAASSSGSLNGCTPSATPAISSSRRCNSAFGTVGTNETPSTSSRASTSAQPAFDIVVGSSSFFLLVPVVLVAIVWTSSGWELKVGELPDRRDVTAVPGRAQHYFVHCEPLRQQGDVEDQVGAILRLHHAGALLGADWVWPLVEDRRRHFTG